MPPKLRFRVSFDLSKPKSSKCRDLASPGPEPAAAVAPGPWINTIDHSILIVFCPDELDGGRDKLIVAHSPRLLSPWADYELEMVELFETIWCIVYLASSLN